MTKIILDSDVFKLNKEEFISYIEDVDVETLIKIKDIVNNEVTAKLEELVL